MSQSTTASARLNRFVEEDTRRAAFPSPLSGPTPYCQTRAALESIVRRLGWGAMFDALAEVMEEASASNPEHSRESLALLRAALEAEKTGRALCQALGLS